MKEAITRYYQERLAERCAQLSFAIPGKLCGAICSKDMAKFKKIREEYFYLIKSDDEVARELAAAVWSVPGDD